MKLAVGITVLAAVAVVAMPRLRGAGCFRFYFTSMGQADASMNPVQRALFSLLLSEARRPETKKGQERRGVLPHKQA
ncbi:MAG TPA: hypothetical protein DEQ47_18355 [Solibacterales bacterium]|nr:hypothetical protein [Bryobacterales bacterium]